MKKYLTQFDWLNMAVSGVRFQPDRLKVQEELRAHMEDKMADLRRVFPDISEEEAWERVLTGMGDPEKVRDELARVHKPWLGWLWLASRWMAYILILAMCCVNMGVHADVTNSLWGRSSAEVYHRVQGGEKARLGQYTFQITGAACLDRPEVEGARDNLQMVLRVSSLRFWERIDPDAVYRGLTAIGPDGVERPMDRATMMRYTIVDELGNTTTRQVIWTGAWICEWGPFWREFAVYVPAEGWEPGDQVRLEVESPAGRIALAAPVTEKVVIP